MQDRSRLPEAGPGRVASGNLALGEISLQAEPVSGAGTALKREAQEPVTPTSTRIKYPVSAAARMAVRNAWTDRRSNSRSVKLARVTRNSTEIEIIRGKPSMSEGGPSSPPREQQRSTFGTSTTSRGTTKAKTSAVSAWRSASAPALAGSGKSARLSAAIEAHRSWQKLAAAYRFRESDQQAIDRLVERRPKLAATIGDAVHPRKHELKDWRRAFALCSPRHRQQTQTTDALLLGKRAARPYEALKNWDSAAADWSRAATGNPDGAKPLADFAQRLAAAGQVLLAHTQFEKAQEVYERLLHADPENDRVATELGQLLSNKHENASSARLTVLRPAEMKSEGGATLTLQPDGSVLASGVNPAKDVYVVKAEFQGPIGAIRLEAIPDPSMPGAGSGRAGSGNFVLTDFRVLAGASVVTWGPASADFTQQNYSGNFPIDLAIDAHKSTGWAIYPEVAERHLAVFIPSRPITAADKTHLTISLAFQNEWPNTALGRFRLSVSEDAAAFEREEKRFAVLKVVGPWARLAAAYALNGRNEEASAIL